MKPLHDILRFVNEGYPFILMGVYVIAFLFAFIMMFIMPQISLLLLFVGLYSLVIAVGLWKLSKFLQHKLADRLLDQGICPNCGHQDEATFISPCRSCLTNFQSHPAASFSDTKLELESGASSGENGIVHS